MKITLLLVGKTTDDYLVQGMEKYIKRINRYISFQLEVIPALKNTKSLSQQQIKEKEGQLILQKTSPNDMLILLDENGKQKSSVDFSNFIQDTMLQSIKNLVFVVGGAYGFSEEVYQRSNQRISLSKMTFSHQIIRLIF